MAELWLILKLVKASWKEDTSELKDWMDTVVGDNYTRPQTTHMAHKGI